MFVNNVNREFRRRIFAIPLMELADICKWDSNHKFGGGAVKPSADVSGIMTDGTLLKYGI